MTFTIAEDIVALLLAYYGASASGLINGGFETNDFTGWDESGAQISNAQFHSGAYSANINSADQYLEQSIALPVNTLTALTFWMMFSTPDAGQSITFEVTYSDTSTYTDSIAYASPNTWVQYDYTTSLHPFKRITKIKFIHIGGDANVFIDDVTITHTAPILIPSIHLLDAATPPDAHTDNGEIIIKNEKLLRIDPLNGVRSETFLVDIDIVLEDTDASSPTDLKVILSETDRVFDTESLAHTSYYYKIRYNWLGSYRLGRIKFQVEVLNALVTRPALV